MYRRLVHSDPGNNMGKLPRRILVISVLIPLFTSCRGTHSVSHPEAHQFEPTPKRVERGRYLVNGVGECFACHGAPDLKARGWPPIQGQEGSGYDFASLGYPGQIAPNITPDLETGVGNWSDDELARAIREGVGHDGHVLDPATMPYEFYHAMSDDDLASIVVYLRSIPPIRNALAPTRRTYVGARHFLPASPGRDLTTLNARGAYLVAIGACQWCHTLRDADRQPLSGLEFAGGDLVTNTLAPASSANLTPDPSGIGYYDEAQFLRTIRN